MNTYVTNAGSTCRVFRVYGRSKARGDLTLNGLDLARPLTSILLSYTHTGVGRQAGRLAGWQEGRQAGRLAGWQAGRDAGLQAISRLVG